jgi:Anticodon binding domain of methionyl tRNA ligase
MTDGLQALTFTVAALRIHVPHPGHGNLTNCTVVRARNYLRLGLPADALDGPQQALLENAIRAAARAQEFDDFDLRSATGPLLDVVAEANRLIEETRPWDLAGAHPKRASRALLTLLDVCRIAVVALRPFVPGVAKASTMRRSTDQCRRQHFHDSIVRVTCREGEIERGRPSRPGATPEGLGPFVAFGKLFTVSPPQDAAQLWAALAQPWASRRGD